MGQQWALVVLLSLVGAFAYIGVSLVIKDLTVNTLHQPGWARSPTLGAIVDVALTWPWNPNLPRPAIGRGSRAALVGVNNVISGWLAIATSLFMTYVAWGAATHGVTARILLTATTVVVARALYTVPEIFVASAFAWPTQLVLSGPGDWLDYGFEEERSLAGGYHGASYVLFGPRLLDSRAAPVRGLLEQDIARLRLEISQARGNDIPTRLLGFPAGPGEARTDWGELNRSINDKTLQIRVVRPAHGARVFVEFFATDWDRRLASWLTLVAFGGPVLLAVLALSVSPWFWVAAPIALIVGQHGLRKHHASILLDGALQSESAFCLLYCCSQICLKSGSA